MNDRDNLAIGDIYIKTERERESEICNVQHLVDGISVISLRTQAIFDTPLSRILIFNPVPRTFDFTS